MGLGCPLLVESSARRLRRCAATHNHRQFADGIILSAEEETYTGVLLSTGVVNTDRLENLPHAYYLTGWRRSSGTLAHVYVSLTKSPVIKMSHPPYSMTLYNE